ncbi:LmeA family phospholipid-binding protein [Hoyosella sp. G463]|uniref:LmeA family phospholipid-binding protein n=1 Tax=Lolliginicoccus lacisalsi TaxID=2742202 RepID=A0A927JE45_9ACTN|nr:LmeA family phospholipid-binding protein [Lolliginicoccus lacisalsi]MBD8507683.1 LmeA family phospholipid-binding protein [Lolliginicoccus lacisalsi]
MRGLLKAVITLLVLLVIVAGAAEIAARFIVGREIQQPLGESWQSEPSTSFGLQPLLPALMDDRIDALSIDSGTIGTGDLRGSALQIDLGDVDITDRENPIAGEVTVIARITAETIFQAIQENDGGDVSVLPGVSVTIDGVVPQPAREALVVELMRGTATVDATPRLQDGTVVVDLGNAEVLGLPLPDAVTDAIKGGTSQSVGALPEGLTATAVTVTEEGVDVTLTGSGLALADFQDDL